MFKYQLFATGSLPHSTCLGDNLWCYCSKSPNSPAGSSPSLQMGQSETGKDSLYSGQNGDLNLRVSVPFAAPQCSGATCSIQCPCSNPSEALLFAQMQPVASAHHLPTADAHCSREWKHVCCSANPSASPQHPYSVLRSSKHIHTPGANSIIHTRRIAMDHPLPLEGPTVNQSQLFFCPPERQANDSNTQLKPAHVDRERHQRPQEIQKQWEAYKAPSCCGKPRHRKTPLHTVFFQQRAGIAVSST